MQSSFAHAQSLSERPKRVLLAEDDDAFRMFLADVLRGDGHEIIEVDNGLRLLEQIASVAAEGSGLEKFDLIVSDIRMPHFDAFEVVAAMRRAEIDVPVVLMTAFGDSRTHEWAEQCRVLDVLDKPFEVDELRTVVCNVLFGHIIGVAAPANEYGLASTSQDHVETSTRSEIST
jgi:CheY-like chemotaxis protein